MKNRRTAFTTTAIAVAAFVASPLGAAPLASVKASNPLDSDRQDARVTVDLDDVPGLSRGKKAPAITFARGGEPIASQIVDTDGDGKPDHLLTVLDFGPSESIELEIVRGESPSTEARTQAEISIRKGGKFEGERYVGGSAFQNVQSLKVPQEHAIHDDYIRYEGPGWESDKVAYRFYLDERNAFDIFGKRTSDMVLQRAGQDDEPTYHEDSEWGYDILKVGNAVGMGGFGYWDGDKIVGVADTRQLQTEIAENGPLVAAVLTRYKGWKVTDEKVDLSALLSIHAGSRLTHVRLHGDDLPDPMAAGIVKHEGMAVLKSLPSDDGAGWSYIATYGQQTLDGDEQLGMAVFFPDSDYEGFEEDQWNHVVVLEPDDDVVEYAFAAAWEGEPNGISNLKQFEDYLRETAKRLANPIKVSVSRSADTK